MRIKLTIFILSVLVAWSSVFISGYRVSYNKEHQLKVASDFIGKVIEADDDLMCKKSSSGPPAIIFNAALAEIHAWNKDLKTSPVSPYQTVSYYLLFRVLRR